MPIAFDAFIEEQHGAVAGGKGRVLAHLYRKGYPVPDGFIIPCSAFDECGLKASVKAEVSRAYQKLCRGESGAQVAVRSSGLSEDSALASYAGQFETVLNVESEVSLFAAIARVFLSGKNENIKHYKAAQNLVTENGIAIVVQHMLAPMWAGVIFTVDPVAGDWQHMQGNVVQGLGDTLVAGEVTGDSFMLHKDTGQYHGPDFLAPYAAELLALSLRLETEFGAPQDIEWAIEDNKLYLLQSRRITTLPSMPEKVPETVPDKWNATLDRDCLWTNTNVGEAHGGVMTPLTASFVVKYIDTANGKIGDNSILGIIAGRAYFNLSVLLSIFDKLWIPRGVTRKLIANIAGTVPENLEIPRVSITFAALFRYIAHQVRQGIALAKSGKAWLNWLEQHNFDWCEKKSAEIGLSLTNAQLNVIFEEFGRTNIKGVKMMVATMNLCSQTANRLESALKAVLPADEVAIMLSGLGGETHLQSMGPLLGVAALTKGSITRDEFNRLYGHRGPNEVEMAAPRSAEEPGWIDKLIEQWGASNPETLLAEQRARRKIIWQKLEMRSKRKANSLSKLYAMTSALATNREKMRSESTRQIWVVRTLVLRAARLNGLTDELFFLHVDELGEFLRGDKSVLGQVAERKRLFAAYSEIPRLPNIISGTFHPFLWAKDPARRTDVFDSHRSYAARDDALVTGFPGSPGVITGVVRVLQSHDQFEQFVSGEILVTAFTNVGWTPLFPRAAAIVTDIGAPLSHAAIVARELGIPAVVGTHNATMKLKTGDRVTVNGSAGTVELLQCW